MVLRNRIYRKTVVWHLQYDSVLTNIKSGHHQWDKGIKTVDEINILYDCGNILPKSGERIMCININKTYKPGSDYYGTRDSIYEATRKYWRINSNRAKTADIVLSVYQGVVRAAFKPLEWKISDMRFPTGDRWEFIELRLRIQNT